MQVGKIRMLQGKKRRGKTTKNKKKTGKKSKDSDWERIKNTYGVKK